MPTVDLEKIADEVMAEREGMVRGYNTLEEVMARTNPRLNLAEDALKKFFDLMHLELPEETYGRIVRMYNEFLYTRNDATPFKFTTFPNEEHMMDLVVMKDIRFFSMCEHHMIPFFGDVHVGYLPHDRIVGLSKIPRVVDWYARRPQLQERLTAQIADYIEKQLRPKGVAVVIEAKHLCVGMRGIQRPDAVTLTSAMRGVFLAQPNAREEFFNLIRR